MLKKLMSRNLNIFSILSGGISVLGVLIAFDDKKLKDNYIKLQNSKELLEKQVNDLKIDELKNELTKNKVEQFRTSLEETQNNIINQFETIQKLEVKNNDQKEILNSHLENLRKENEDMQNMISDIVNYFNDNDKNKFIGDSILEFFTNYIDNWNKMLSTLSFEQLLAITNLCDYICISINLFTIMSILFGDQVIKYFKLEERFPKLGFIFKIRNKFNNFNLVLSFIIIICVLIV